VAPSRDMDLEFTILKEENAELKKKASVHEARIAALEDHIQKLFQMVHASSTPSQSTNQESPPAPFVVASSPEKTEEESNQETSNE